jgi:hypothetical protein
MQREIMFHLGDLICRIQSIKFVQLNSRRVEVLGKVGSMRTLVMGRVIVILIRWLFRRGRVWGMSQEVLFEVFDVGTLFLEDINSQIE